MESADPKETREAEKPASKKRAGFSLSLKGRALRYLAAREHSRAELERKLAPHEESPGQLAQVLDDLEAKDFISEVRVVESVINRKAGKFGASRIQQELYGKGLDATVVRETIAQLKPTELERARAVWQRKFGVLPRDPAERAKQTRFLATRGFEPSLASRIFRSHEDDLSSAGSGDQEV